MSLKLPILCRVGHKTLIQYKNIVVVLDTHYLLPLKPYIIFHLPTLPENTLTFKKLYHHYLRNVHGSDNYQGAIWQTLFWMTTCPETKQVSKVIWQNAALPSCHPGDGEWIRLSLTPSNTWFLGSAGFNPSPPKWHLDLFSHFCTDRQTRRLCYMRHL